MRALLFLKVLFAVRNPAVKLEAPCVVSKLRGCSAFLKYWMFVSFTVNCKINKGPVSECHVFHDLNKYRVEKPTQGRL